MIARRKRAGVVRKEATSEQKLRARVFCLCKELGISDDARKILASTYRADGKESMSGMRAGELYEMVGELERRDVVRFEAKKQVRDAERQEKLRQHKRVDGPDSAYASERARHYLRSQCESYYGADWPQRTGIFLGGLWLKWEKKCDREGQAYQRPRDAMSITPPGPPAEARGELVFIPWDSEYLPRNFHHWATEAMIAMIRRAAKEGGQRR